MKVAEILVVHRQVLRHLTTLSCFDRATHSSACTMELFGYHFARRISAGLQQEVPDTLSPLMYRERPFTLS